MSREVLPGPCTEAMPFGITHMAYEVKLLWWHQASTGQQRDGVVDLLGVKKLHKLPVWRQRAILE